MTWDELPGRRPSHNTKVDHTALFAGKRVLVTGAAGCIGGALAQAISVSNVAQLILLDISEQGIYELQGAFEGAGQCDRITLVLGDICDTALLTEVFKHHAPQIIFHAAAFKHVPLLEQHPFAAIANNSLATAKLAALAADAGCEQCILVSTDKAADPVSVMGASKRIAEMVLQAMHASGAKTKFKAIRLGNVLDSSGSIVPLFTQQITAGLPVTITHPEVRRYFITIEEAAATLLAGASPHDESGIHAASMGEPVRIVDLARHMLSGLQHELHASPRPEPQIRYIGLRPGDKMEEVLLAANEAWLAPGGDADTQRPLRRIDSPCPSPQEVNNALTSLEQAVRQRDLTRLIETIRNILPAYQPSSVIIQRLQALSEVLSETQL